MKRTSPRRDLNPRPKVYETIRGDLSKFKEHVFKTRRENTAKTLYSYAVRYGHVLRTNDASELMKLSNKNRLHAMASLAALAKFNGCYNVWKDIRERHQLKWSNEENLNTFNEIFNSNHTLSQMLIWLKDAICKLPKSYGNILLYNTLTGLRPSEACESISLLQNDLQAYLREDKLILEHYKYPSLFLRKTKKAYISIANDSILEIGKESGNHGYNGVRLALKRRGLAMHAAYCRKIFATHLRTNGIEQETIDLLQGRIAKSVFARFYFRPDFDFNKISSVIASLHAKIIVK